MNERVLTQETRTGFTSSYGYQFAPGTGKGASGSK